MQKRRASGRGIDHRGRRRTVKEDLPSSSSFYTGCGAAGRNTRKVSKNDNDRSPASKIQSRSRGFPRLGSLSGRDFSVCPW